MNTIYDLVVVLHLLGMAALVGGYLVVARERSPRPGFVMLWGARAQLLTGLVIVGLGEGADVWDHSPNYTKITVKLVVALVVLGLTEMAAARSRRSVGADVATFTHLAGALATLNVLVAALW